MPTDNLPHVDPAQLPGMIDPPRTALVVIDVQEDFAGPAGAIGRVGLDMSRIEPAIDRIGSLIAAARAAGAHVAFARVITRPETDSSALRLRAVRQGRSPDSVGICRAGSSGAGYYRVAPEPGDLEVQKRLYDSFHETSFDADLRARGVDTLVFVGFTTDCCVDATARAAFHRNYNVFVVSDACDAYDSELHHWALKALQKNVALLTDTAAVLSVWPARAHAAAEA
jgi:nicotinamidase-related amidase